ncbi:MAG: dihydrodipicolinate synthase family protein [Candidatus Lokiarchaeota archaeon]|nr:dihydrodipicolinate synthase family protein [Candidatus Lokiarchaeota archaeon]
MSKIEQIRGIICPTITFFDENYNINEELNSLLFRHVLLNGANSLLLFGTTGEGPYFSNRIEDKIKLIRLAYEVTKEEIPIITGIFGNNSDVILNEIETLGKKFKYLSFMIPPPMEPMEEEGLKGYYSEIFENFCLENKILLYNNPNLFLNNNISPSLLSSLREFPTLLGIKDSSDKFGNYKGYIEHLGEDFMVCCGRERQFSHFLQLIPNKSRRFAGLVPSIGNLVNICLKLYQAALEDDPLQIEKFQTDINDFREKIFGNQDIAGKQQRGLKYAFYHLYKISTKTPFVTAMTVSPDFNFSLEEVAMDRIEATVRYLLNLNYINKIFPIENNYYSFSDIKAIFSNTDFLKGLGDLKRLRGPYERIGRQSTIFRLKLDQDIVLKCKDNNVKEGAICGEKLLFPFLDGTLDINTLELRTEIKKIVSKTRGRYIFSSQKPPILPASDLIYYDESKEILPCIYSLHSYIQGKPFYFYLKSVDEEKIALDSPKLVNLFKNLGVILGTLHGIKFNAFYERITDISKKSAELDWSEIFNREIENILQGLKNNKFEYIDIIKAYIRDNFSLIEEEKEPIAIHNDFGERNIIVKEEPTSIQLNGIINFDNWRIGVKAQDFVHIYLTTRSLSNCKELRAAFHEGYDKTSKLNLNRDFLKKIEIYTVKWQLEELNRMPNNEHSLLYLKNLLSL